MSYTFKFRRGTAAQWTTDNPTLSAGEPGFESDSNKVKIGDGIHAWTTLPYLVASNPDDGGDDGDTDGVQIFTQADDPGDVADGSIWFVTSETEDGGGDDGDIPEGYPNASNTGVPTGTTLTTRDTDWNYTIDNGIIDGFWFQGASLHIRASNVTVQNCKFTDWSTFALTQDTEAVEGTGTLIQDCEFGPPMFDPDDPHHAFGATQIVDSNFTLLRCNLWGCENGVSCGNDVTIQDCYIHDLNMLGDDPHSDCIQTGDGSTNIVVRHNTLISMGVNNDGDLVGGTSCFISPQASTSPTGFVIHDNVMAGGAFALYGPQNGQGVDCEVTNNKFWTKYFATVGNFGPWTDANDEATVSGNVMWPANTPLT